MRSKEWTGIAPGEAAAAPAPGPLHARLRAAQLIRGHWLFTLVLGCWLVATFGAFVADDLVAWSAGLFYVTYDTWLLGYVAWKTARLEPKPQVAGAAPRLAVLIPARNEASVLAACLDAVLAQCEPGDEVVVVDDGSTDGSAALLAQRHGVPAGGSGRVGSASVPALSVWRKPHSGKADSLNCVWPHVAAPVVVTLDADTVLQPAALSAVRAAFGAEPQLVAACGVLLPRCRRAPLSWLYEWFQTFEYLRAFLSRAAWERSNALLLVSGAFAAYRRDMLAALGGYDAASLVEDYELIHRLHRHALDRGLPWTVRVLGAARAVTDAPATLAQFLRQRERWFAGFLETQFENADMVGARERGALGRLMLPIKSVDTLQPLFGVTAFVLLVWFLFTWSPIAVPVLAVIGLKLAIDFGYHLWALDRYHRWLGQPAGLGTWLRSMAATFAEPFSFQLMRHAGAIRGWWSFLTGRIDWSPQRLNRPT